MQSSLPTLKSPVLHLSNPTSSPEPLVTINLLTVSTYSPFPECHKIGLVQYVAFPAWFLSLCQMHLNFLYVILCLDSSFLFTAE